MGIFNQKPRKPEEGQSPAAGFPASGSRADFVQQMKEQARQLQAQAQAMQAPGACSRPRLSARPRGRRGRGRGGLPGRRRGAGPMSWARQVMSILAPPSPASSSAAPA